MSMAAMTSVPTRVPNGATVSGVASTSSSSRGTVVWVVIVPPDAGRARSARSSPWSALCAIGVGQRDGAHLQLALGAPLGDLTPGAQPRPRQRGQPLQRLTQVPHPAGLSGQVRVQPERHGRAGGRLVAQLGDMVDERAGEGGTGVVQAEDEGDVVRLQPVRHREQPAGPRLEPGRGVAVRPVRGVAHASLDQQLLGGLADGEAGGEPAGDRPPGRHGESVQGPGDAVLLDLALHAVMRRAVVPAVRQHVPPRGEDARHDVGPQPADLRVERRGGRHAEIGEQPQQPPHAAALAVTAPAGVGDVQPPNEVRLQRRSRPSGEEVFDIDHRPHGHRAAFRPERPLGTRLRPHRPGRMIILVRRHHAPLLAVEVVAGHPLVTAQANQTHTLTPRQAARLPFSSRAPTARATRDPELRRTQDGEIRSPVARCRPEYWQPGMLRGPAAAPVGRRSGKEQRWGQIWRRTSWYAWMGPATSSGPAGTPTSSGSISCSTSAIPAARLPTTTPASAPSAHRAPGPRGRAGSPGPTGSRSAQACGSTWPRPTPTSCSTGSTGTASTSSASAAARTPPVRSLDSCTPPDCSGPARKTWSRTRSASTPAARTGPTTTGRSCTSSLTSLGRTLAVAGRSRSSSSACGTR